MKYIKKFSEIDKEHINEGILGRIGTTILLSGLAFLYSCGNKNETEKHIKQLQKQQLPNLIKKYNMTSIADSNIAEININKLKNTIVKHIKEDTNIDNTLKPNIIKSIQRIPFFIIDDTSMVKISNDLGSGRTFVAAYISSYNIILLNKKNLISGDSSFLANTILHELSHYVDNINNKSDDMRFLVDKKMLGEENIRKKFTEILKIFNLEEKAESKIFNDFFPVITRNAKYFTSREEYYVRYINFKMWLISEGQIKDINEEIRQKHITYFYESLEENLDLISADFFYFVFFLDENKIKP